MIRGGRVMYLTWAVPHFILQMTTLDHLAAATGTVLVVALGLAIAFPAKLLRLITVTEP